MFNSLIPQNLLNS